VSIDRPKTPSQGVFAVTDPGPRIWVDADACPAVVKDILYRAAERTRTPLILVANQWLTVPRSPWIRMVQVPRGFDVADNHIAEQARAGDLVITADIPLAAAVVEKGAAALSPRGEEYTANNVRSLLDMRNAMDQLRASGLDTGGPPAFSQADRQAFASKLDRWLARKPSPPASPRADGGGAGGD
jgi:uncharacterized protein YaiI (UPF0178 family)